MRPYDKVIGIHGVPRSGTSWLAQIINSNPMVNFKFQPLFSYAFKDNLNDKSTFAEIESFFERIYFSEDYFINMKDPELHKNYPSFKKNEIKNILAFKHVRYHNLLPHLMKECHYLELVLIVRNPLSVLTSWANAPKEFNPLWNFDQEWEHAKLKNKNRKEEYFGYQKWKEATLIFEKLSAEYPERVSLIQYKNLLSNPTDVIRKIHLKHNIEIDTKTIKFLDESRKRHDKDPNSVFKSRNIDNDYDLFISRGIKNKVISDLSSLNLERYIS